MPEDQKYVIRGVPPDRTDVILGIAPDPALPPAGAEPLPPSMGEDIVQAAIDDAAKKPEGMLRYNDGKARGTLIPASFTRYTAVVLEYGAIKYDANNWRKGGSWTSAIDSLTRHLDAFREGEDLDPESTLPHLAHLAFGVMILIEFYDKGLGTDDRFRYPDQPRDAQLPGRVLSFRRPPDRA